MLQPLFAFIGKYWHLSREALVFSPFDLEECFTFLDLRRHEAIASGDQAAIGAALRLERLLTDLLLDFLSECEHWFHDCKPFRELARVILRKKSAVLTFNYDMLLELAIESETPSRVPEMGKLVAGEEQNGVVTDEQMGYSPHEWNAYAAYGVDFDTIALRIPGNLRLVDGSRYFTHPRNQLTPPRFLKLHGSLGWFSHSGYRIDGSKLESAPKATLRRSIQRIGSPELDYEDGEVLLPLLITPVLNKRYDQHPIFRSIWTQAKEDLTDCETLVVGGYSFPPTDFHVRRLLREAFAERGPESLCIINPDSAVVHVAKDLCNFRGDVAISHSVEEFVGGPLA